MSILVNCEKIPKFDTSQPIDSCPYAVLGTKSRIARHQKQHVRETWMGVIFIVAYPGVADVVRTPLVEAKSDDAGLAHQPQLLPPPITQAIGYLPTTNS
jgi:hypothetical protein